MQGLRPLHTHASYEPLISLNQAHHVHTQHATRNTPHRFRTPHSALRIRKPRRARASPRTRNRGNGSPAGAPVRGIPGDGFGGATTGGGAMIGIATPPLPVSSGTAFVGSVIVIGVSKSRNVSIRSDPRVWGVLFASGICSVSTSCT